MWACLLGRILIAAMLKQNRGSPYQSMLCGAHAISGGRFGHAGEPQSRTVSQKKRVHGEKI
jgi:hypothetical protein